MAPLTFDMLFTINILQLIFYIAALALLGQGLLYVLAGAKRAGNFFYQVFQIINRPFFALARLMAPKQIADSQIGFVAAFIVAIFYVSVSLWKIDYCISVNMVGCKG
ncbi:MAG: hypothetical protein RL211_954 [Pseudomonadota bacterium]|jgi:hypothetical protein